MRLGLAFTEHFTAPVQNVWLAITDRRMLALWLMENDFEPRLGAICPPARRSNVGLARVGGV